MVGGSNVPAEGMSTTEGNQAVVMHNMFSITNGGFYQCEKRKRK